MEWTVIEVLIAVGGFGLAIGAPIIKLNTNITRLTTVLETMETRIRALE